MFCDNYLDGGYHVPYAHKGLMSSLDLETYSTTVYSFCSSLTFKLAGNLEINLFVLRYIRYLIRLVSKNVEVVPRLVKKTVSIGLDLKLCTLSSTQIS